MTVTSHTVVDSKLRQELDSIASAEVADRLEDELVDAVNVFVKRDASGNAVGFAIVVLEMPDKHYLRSLEPVNDKELLDRVYDVYASKKLTLDYGDDEGAKRFVKSRVESKMVSQVIRQKTGKVFGAKRRRSTRRKNRRTRVKR